MHGPCLPVYRKDRHSSTTYFSLVVLKTVVFVSGPKFCGLGLGLEALVLAVFETDQ